MRAIAAALAVALALPLTASADPVTAGAYGDHVHIVRSGAFEITGGGGAPALQSTSAYEISMVIAKFEQTLGAEEPQELDAGGCFDIFSVATQTLDSGCGTLTIVADGALQTTRVTGTLETSASDYVNDPEYGPGFVYRGPSTITIDLTFTGTGLIQPKESHRTFVGFCGLPPDTRGASIGLELPLIRAATAAGTLASAVHGAIDPGLLEPELIEAQYVEAGGKLEGCL